MAQQTKTQELKTPSQNQTNPNRKKSRKKSNVSTSQKWINALNTAGTIAGAISNIGMPVANLAMQVAKVIKAFRTNDKAWYTKYGPVDYARNENRPMDAIFNKSITTNATMGAIPKHIDINVNWTGYSNTFMFDQVVRASYQDLRMQLRSNLPYSANKLKAYLVNAIALAIMAKQLERDVQWNMFTDPKDRNFNKMWKLTNPAGSYGAVALSPISYLSSDMSSGYAEWSNTIAQYDVFASVYNSAIQLPEALGRFISHYFGSVFTDSSDDFNDQYIRLMIGSVDWADYDKISDTITYTTVSLSSLSIDDLINLTNDLSIESGMITADLLKSSQLSASVITKFGNFIYEKVYDPGFLQALINAYTDPSAVTQYGYVRMDRMFGVEDDLTQFVFTGGLQEWDGYSSQSGSTSKVEVPAITVVNMTIKFDTDNELHWPSGIFQSGTLNPNTSYEIVNQPFGLAIKTSMSSDVRIEANILGNTVPFYFDESPVPLADAAIFNWVTDTSPSSLVREINIVGGFASDTVYLLLPIFSYQYQDYQNEQGSWKYDDWYACFTARVSSDRSTPFTYSSIYKSSGEFTVTASNPGKPTKPYTWLTCTTGKSITDKSKWVSTTAFIDPNNNARLSYGDVQQQFNLLKFTGSEGATIEWENPFGFTLVNVGSGIEYGLRIRPISASTQIQVHGALPSTGRPNDISSMISPITYRGEWLLSGTYHIATISLLGTGSESPNKVSIFSGMSQLASYAADVFDYHIPMFTSSNVQVNIYTSDNVTVNESIQTDGVLLKENYIPYYYNILDLVPTLYSMFTSLFSTNSRERNKENTTR